MGRNVRNRSEIPIPSIGKQYEIIAEYQPLSKPHQKLNEQLNKKLEEKRNRTGDL